MNSSALVFNIDALVGPTEKKTDGNEMDLIGRKTNRVFQRDNRVKLMYCVRDVNQYRDY